MLYRYEINRKCSRCQLSYEEGTIAGQSEVPFEEVKLIVISAYPGSREYKAGISLADNPSTSKQIPDSNKAPVGAGEYLRYCLRAFIDNCEEIPDLYKPIEKYTYFTNAIKCNPQHGKDKITVTNKHIKVCRDNWLINELNVFPTKVPIFICASEAVKAILGIDESLYNNRNKVNYYKGHPVIVSTNPVDWEKYLVKYVSNIETARNSIVSLIKRGKLSKHKKEIDKIIGAKRMIALPGSPLYFVKQDIILLKQEIVNYIKESEEVK